MAGNPYGRKNDSVSPEFRRLAKMARVPGVSFCEVTHCIRLASWRIGYDDQIVDLCPRHTLATMKNRRVWLGTTS